MAVTLTNVVRHSSGDQMKVVATCTTATGIDTITAASLGLTIIEDASAISSVGYAYDIVPATGGASATITVYYVTSATTSPLTAYGSGALVVAPTIVVYGR